MNDRLAFETEPFELESEFDGSSELLDQEQSDSFEFDQEFGGGMGAARTQPCRCCGGSTGMAREQETEWDSEVADFETEQEAASPRPAMGAAGQQNAQQTVNQQRMALARMAQAIPRMARHVKKEGERFRFTLQARSLAEASTRLGLPPGMVGALLKSIRQANEQVAKTARSSEFDMEGSFDEFDGEVGGQCPGMTRTSTHWWGLKIMLNECHTKTLLDAMSKAGTASSICARLAPEPRLKAVCRVLGPLLRVGAFAIRLIDRLGGNRGIIIRRPWVTPPPLPPIIVWHQ